jgi:hypothetical protein
VTSLLETRNYQWRLCPERANGSGALLKDANLTGVFDHYKFASPVALIISQTQISLLQTNQISKFFILSNDIKFKF